jgi:glycosyl transferase family 87
VGLVRFAIPAGMACAYIGIVLLIGTPGGWRDFGVPGESPSFLDLRNVTTSWVCHREGIAVLPKNPCDPLDRPANQPRIWLLPSHLGLGESATVPLGIVIGILFLVAAISLAPRDGPLWLNVAFGLFLCTPGIMLGVERGNIDLIVFCVLVLAVRLFTRPPGRVWAALLVLFDAILKLYPIAATPMLLRQPRRQAIATATAVLVGFGVYVAATFGDIRAILEAVPKSGSFSYGLDILGHPVSKVLGVGDRFVWDVLLALGAVAAAFVLVRYLRRLPAPAPAPRFEVDAFVAGASVYVFSYAFFRSFDYRLAFLLLTLPLLLRRAAERRPEAWAALALCFGTLWLESRHVLPAGVLVQYALFILLLAHLAPLLTEQWERSPRVAAPPGVTVS